MIDLLPHLQRIPDAVGRGITRLFGSRNERLLQGLRPIVAAIAAEEEELRKLSDGELQAKTPAFKERLRQGGTLDDILPEAFAVVREASRRTLGLRHFDVQMMGGILLHRGTVIEMMTGEGKTLVATCPAYLNALAAQGAHVITVNDYLAQRDGEWMGRIYRFLGLSVGCIQSHVDDPAEKRRQYECDLTYGTGNEFGFDYLRDNMKVRAQDLVQGQLNFAIIDEADSILIDEARTPLIISGPAEDNDEHYIVANRLAQRLKKGADFTVDEKETSLSLTEDGIRRCEEFLGVAHLYSGQAHMPHYINNALRAHHLFRRDKDYVTQGGEVLIVDEHTGRLMPGRRWSDGLHQAVEAKEGLPIKRESQTLASITFQNLFKLYRKVSGMTGTAMTEAAEFHKIYNVEVVAVPPNRPCVRVDQPDLVFGTLEEKLHAIVEEIAARHEKGQPMLVGTASIESSEVLSHRLAVRGLPHEVLNAKNHGREAQIIAQAGRLKAVTVATNMAGRGTDIVLGGNVEVLVRGELGAEAEPAALAETISARRPAFEEEHRQVVGLGGLYVLGTERHEARRIDNQLRGRSGRQGDPGESRFYLSLEDDLMRRFAPPWAARLMQKSGLRDGEPIEHPLITKSIANAQKRVEEYHFEARKHLLEYDEVMNEQRKYIYGVRARVLREEKLGELVTEWVGDAIALRMDQLATDLQVDGDPAKVDREFHLWVERNFLEKIQESPPLAEREPREVEDEVSALFRRIYEKKRQSLGDEACGLVERYLLLQTLDMSWKEHLYNMDHVKDAIGWRGYAQVDPRVEYKKEAYRLFREMLNSMKNQVATLAVRLSIAAPGELEVRSVYNEEQAIHSAASAPPSAAAGSEQAGEKKEPEPEVTKPIVNSEKRVGRNEPCPCGSGRKFKQCCGATAKAL